MDRIAVLIPCYNESSTIEKVIKDYKESLPEAVIYVYDNNSSDGTDIIAKNGGAVVRYEHRQGKGNVVRSMFADIDAQCYIMVDGDDTYPASAAGQMAELVLDGGADMVVGDRLSSTYFSENKRPFHNFGNSIVRNTINRLFDCNIKDIMTGYRAFSYSFVKTFPVLSEGFEIETEMTIHAVDKNLAIENVIIDYKDRPEGSESKLDTIPDGFKVLRTILRLYSTYRPLNWFGVIALVLTILAAAFIIPVITEYASTGLVRRFPTLIVCGFVFVTAILSFFTGLILNHMYRKNRRDFELQYYNAKREERSLLAEH